jgi:hypothetical protein
LLDFLYTYHYFCEGFILIFDRSYRYFSSVAAVADYLLSLQGAFKTTRILHTTYFFQ